MRYPALLLALASILLFSITSYAVELELIPGGFPAAQKPAFTRERIALLAEKRALEGKVARYNKQCAHPQAYQAHKCDTDRLALFQLNDAYKLKVLNFNKRLAVIDNGPVKKPKPAAQ